MFSEKNSLIPLERWLDMPLVEIKDYIKANIQKPLTVFFSIDGTRRYYLKEKYRLGLAENETGADNDQEVVSYNFAEYSKFITRPLMQVFDLLFSAGVTNVLNIALLPSTFHRPNNYLSQMLKETERVFLNSAEFNQLYSKHGLRLRLFGDYDIAPETEKVREQLDGLTQRCHSLWPETNEISPSLYLGFYGGTFTQEITLRSARFFSENGRVPTDAELRQHSFPAGLSGPIDILISAGWLKVGGILPPLLDGGTTDIYNLSFLALDLDETTLKRILYDHLFLRNQATDDNADYTHADIRQLHNYYTQHQGGLVGLGQLVGSGLWYALHPQTEYIQSTKI